MLYTPLTRSQIVEIMHLMIQNLEKRLADRRLSVKLTPAAEDYVIENGYDSAYGARPLKRFLQKSVETAIAKLLIAQYVPEDSRLIIDVENDEIVVRVEEGCLEGEVSG